MILTLSDIRRNRTALRRSGLVHFLIMVAVLLCCSPVFHGQTPSPTPDPNAEKIAEANKSFGEAIDLFNAGSEASLASAREKFARVRAICEELGDEECTAATRFYLAKIADTFGDNTLALKTYDEALVLFRKLGKQDYEMIVLSNVGLIYSNTGNPRLGLETFDKALEISRQIKNRTFEGMILNNIGKAYLDLGENVKARDQLELSLTVCKEAGNAPCVANVLSNLGSVYYGLRDLAKALEYLEMALAANDPATDKSGRGVILTNLGKIYSDRGDRQKAKGYYEQALTICSETGFKQCEAAVSNNLGEIATLDGDRQNAIRLFERSLVLSRSCGDRSQEATTLTNLAGVYLKSGDYRKVLDNIDQALAIAKTINIQGFAPLGFAIRGLVYVRLGEAAKGVGDAGEALLALKLTENKNDPATALTFALVGEIYVMVGEPRKSLEYLDQGVAIGKVVQDPSTLAVALTMSGAAYAALSQPRKALEFLDQAITLTATTHDISTRAMALNLSAGAYFLLGEPGKARPLVDEALSIAVAAGDKTDQALALIILGKSLVGVEPQKALAYLEQALAISREIGDKNNQALALVRLGEAYFVLGEPQKALDYLNEGLPLAEKVGDKVIRIAGLTMLGLTYSALGQYPNALDYINKALPLARAMEYGYGEVLTLNSLAKVHFMQREYYRSVGFAKDALSIAIAIDDKGGIAASFSILSGNYFMMGDADRALDYSNQGLELYRTLGDKTGEVLALNNIGMHYFSTANYERAIDYFNQAIIVNEPIAFKTGEALLFSNLMVAWHKRGNPQFAIFYGKQTINIYQVLRSKLKGADSGLQKSFLSSVEDNYRYLADVLVETGRVAEAEQVLGMLKEEEIYSYLRRDDKVAKDLVQNATMSEEERGALTRYNDLADKITAAGKEFGELDAERRSADEGKFTRQARYDELKKQLADATVAFQKFLDELKVKFGQKDERVVQIDSGLQNTLKRLKADRTAVISTIVGDKRLSLIVTTSATQRAHTIDISEKDVNDLVVEFRSALTHPGIDPRPAGQKLYDILVKPVEADLAGMNADTILWSLDGTLRYIPTAALWDKDKGYLAERFANDVLTLASRETLALPITDKTGWKGLGVGVSQATEGFTALPAVPDELDCIITGEQSRKVSANPICKSGVLTGRKLLDDKFSITGFEDAMGRYPIVHIASHFSLNPGNDKDSFLLLGGGDQRRFTVADLRSLSLTDVELITLSACNTATPGGEKANGVEIEGFGAVAQKQGAKAVLASLWSVADDSTREWMVKFYQLYGTGGLTKAEAMRQAQIAMIYGKYKSADGNSRRGAEPVPVAGAPKQPVFKKDDNAPYSHPYYWAPFVLIGNWR